MHNSVRNELSRREVVVGGMIAGAAAFLAACESASPTRSAGLPGPLWPDAGTGATVPPPPVRTPPSGPVAPPRGVMPRTAWTSAAPQWSVATPMRGIQRITIHHDAINSLGLSGQGNIAKRLESIRRSHRARGSNWVDIGYHYVVDPDGRVWQGRPISIEGAHVSENNPHNLGIMVMGNFDEHRPTSAALAALSSFVADQMRRYRVPVNRVYTHQEIKASACPGRNLQGYMLSARGPGGPLRYV